MKYLFFLSLVSFGVCYEDNLKIQDSTLLQFDEDAIMDLTQMKLTTVPCSFCNSSLLVLLEHCKATNGISITTINDFLIQCSEIDLNLTSLAANCSQSDFETKRVNYIYERRLRCAKIFRGLVKMSDPYDPCTNIRNDYQKNSMSVCRMGQIDCQTIPPLTIVQSLAPPYHSNLTVEYQPPPLTCSEYVNKIISTCHDLKIKDFYARTNLLDWCNMTYNGTYEREGCELVAELMSKRDNRMDLCSGLKIFPINDLGRADFCEEFMFLPSNLHVPLVSYENYLGYISGVDKVIEYTRVEKLRPVLSNNKPYYLPASKH